jgi:hypothetical protein
VDLVHLARDCASRGLALALPSLMVLAACALPVAAAPYLTAEQMHTRAAESFRQGRFPEAYGRFVDLANAGHAPSARYALWMCAEGPQLFGKDWDCAPHEVLDWTRLSDSCRSDRGKPCHSLSPTGLQGTARRTILAR